jgi:hypothetical protein
MRANANKMRTAGGAMAAARQFRDRQKRANERFKGAARSFVHESHTSFGRCSFVPTGIQLPEFILNQT